MFYLNLSCWTCLRLDLNKFANNLQVSQVRQFKNWYLFSELFRMFLFGRAKFSLSVLFLGRLFVLFFVSVRWVWRYCFVAQSVHHVSHWTTPVQQPRRGHERSMPWKHKHWGTAQSAHACLMHLVWKSSSCSRTVSAKASWGISWVWGSWVSLSSAMNNLGSEFSQNVGQSCGQPRKNQIECTQASRCYISQKNLHKIPEDTKRYQEIPAPTWLYRFEFGITV